MDFSLLESAFGHSHCFTGIMVVVPNILVVPVRILVQPLVFRSYVPVLIRVPIDQSGNFSPRTVSSVFFRSLKRVRDQKGSTPNRIVRTFRLKNL